MDGAKTGQPDLAVLKVASVGRLISTDDEWEPYRLLDANGAAVVSVAVFLRELMAAGRSRSTLRSYAMDLLRWWRFLHAVAVCWDRATRVVARDFSCWIQLTVKPRRQAARTAGALGTTARRAGVPNPVTGKPMPGIRYAPATVAHSETVLRSFYDYHRDAGTGPVLNPFPLDAARRAQRAHAHHNPMHQWSRERVGRYRPSRSGFPPVSAPRSCSGCASATWIQGSS